MEHVDHVQVNSSLGKPSAICAVGKYIFVCADDGTRDIFTGAAKLATSLAGTIQCLKSLVMISLGFTAVVDGEQSPLFFQETVEN